jgi:hypothetical protein
MLLFGPSLAFVRLMLPLATGLASLPVARALLVGALLVRAAVGFERAAGFAAPGSRLILPLMAPAGLLPVFAFTV